MINLKIIPSYKCSVGCQYCKMDSANVNDELTVRDALDFVDDNINDINIDNVKLITGESWEMRHNWVQSLLTKFDCVTLVTKLINDDLSCVADLCMKKKLRLIVSYTNLDRLKEICYLKKHIDFVDVVVSRENIDHVYEIVKWTTENYIAVHLTPEITTDPDRVVSYDEIFKVFDKINSEIGLMNVLNFTDLIFQTDTSSVNQITIDPSGRLYSCTMDSGIHGNTSDSIYNIYDNRVSDVTNQCYKIKNEICEDCDIGCEGKCFKFTGLSLQNTCNMNKALDKFKPSHKLINPDQVQITLTYACNMNCNYCFEKERNREFDGWLSPTDTVNLIKYLNRLSLYKSHPTNISLFGGEPTLNMDAIRAVADFFVNNQFNNITTMIQTNLYNLTDEMIDVFRILHENVPLQIVTSLDGDINANCHRLSGEHETFMTVLTNIQKLKSVIPDINIHLCSVLTSESIKTFAESVNLILALKDLGYITGFSWSHVDEVTEGFELTEDDIARLAYIYHKEVRPQIVNRSDFEDLQVLFGGLRLEMNFGNNLSSKSEKPKPYVCNFGNSSLAVMPNGRILPCYKCVNKYFKNTQELYIPKFGEPILQIFKDICMDEEKLAYRDIKCCDCGLVNFCNWCPVVNMITSNHDDMHNQYYKKCVRIKLIAKYNIKYMIENLESEILELILENQALLDKL